MPTLLRAVALAVCATMLAGCHTRTKPFSPNAVAMPIADFKERMQRNGSITFRSWDGKALGMDSDTELTFYPNNTIHMFEWGYSLSSYKGSYQLQPGGHVKVQFKGFKGTWPDMVLTRDSKSLLLAPASDREGFVMGSRGGATLPGGKGSYWPFRMITGKDEQEVQKMIAEHGH